MATQLIESLTEPFEPEQFEDTYRNQVLDLIDRKAAGEEIVAAPPRPPRTRSSTSWRRSRPACVTPRRPRPPPHRQGGVGAGGEADEDEGAEARQARTPPRRRRRPRRPRPGRRPSRPRRRRKRKSASVARFRPARPGTTVEVEGRRLTLSNLDKVLYPETGTTKAEVIDYYARIAPAMVPHLADRGVTLRRFPDGVEAARSSRSAAPSHRPEWLGTVLGPGDRNGDIGYCCLDSAPALVWAANMAALEIHAPMARRDIDTPTMCVFDLDPGAGNVDRRVRRRGPRHPPRARGPRPGGLREDVGLEGPAGLRAAEHAPHAPRGVGLRPGRGPAARAGAPRRCGVEHEEEPAQGQGAGGLEPEQPPQDDRGRVLAAGPAPPHRVDAGRWDEVEAAAGGEPCPSRRPTCWPGWPTTATCSRRR